MIVPYDFRKPMRLPPEWQHRLSGWYQSACALVNRAWAKELPSLQASVGGLDTDYAQEALAKLPATALAYRVLVAGNRLPTLLVLPRLLILQLISIMLGDDPAAAADRELTVVEENLAEYFLVHLWLPYFRESWPAPALVPWELGELERNPQASRFFPPRDVLLSLPWEIRGPWGKTSGLWFFQKAGILETLGEGRLAREAPIDEAAVAVRKQALVQSLPLRIEFVLGTAELKLSELSRLQAGDVLLLDQRQEEGVTAGAGNHTLFRGSVGRVGSWKAFRIESFSAK